MKWYLVLCSLKLYQPIHFRVSLRALPSFREENTLFLAPKRLIAFCGGDTVFFFIKFTLSDPLSRRQEKWYWFLLNRNHVRVSNGGYRRFACLEAFEVFQVNYTLQSLTKLSGHVALTATWDPVTVVKNGVIEQQHASSTWDTHPQDAWIIRSQKQMLFSKCRVSEIMNTDFPSFIFLAAPSPHPTFLSIQQQSLVFWFLFHLLQFLPLPPSPPFAFSVCYQCWRKDWLK